MGDVTFTVSDVAYPADVLQTAPPMLDRRGDVLYAVGDVRHKAGDLVEYTAFTDGGNVLCDIMKPDGSIERQIKRSDPRVIIIQERVD
jgi:hypothetical protein